MDIDGDMIVVASSHHKTSSTYGAVYWFTHSGSSWVQGKPLTGGALGDSVSIDKKLVATWNGVVSVHIYDLTQKPPSPEAGPDFTMDSGPDITVDARLLDAPSPDAPLADATGKPPTTDEGACTCATISDPPASLPWILLALLLLASWRCRLWSGRS